MHAGALTSRLPRWAVIRDARRRHRRRVRRRAIALAALAAVGILLWTQRSEAGLAGSPSTGTGSVELGGSVMQTQAIGGRIWILTCVHACASTWPARDREQLVEVNASGLDVIRRYRFADAGAFAVTRQGLWVARFLRGEIERIDPASGHVIDGIGLRLPAPIVPHDRHFLPTSLTAADGYLWASSARGLIAQIDIRRNQLVRMVRTPSENNATTIDRYGTWVAEDLDGVGLLAPHRTRLRVRALMQAGLPLEVSSVLSGRGVVWAVASTNVFGTPTQTVVVEMNPRTGRVMHRIQLPEASGAVLAGGALYLGVLDRGRIYRVSSNGRSTSFTTARRHARLATASPGFLWATTDSRHGRLIGIRLPRA